MPRHLFLFLLLLAGCLPPKQGETPLPPSLEEKPFLIVIPPSSNEKDLKRTLDSISEQNYTRNRTLLIEDKAEQGALSTLYSAIHRCSDHEIVLLLPTGSWLSHEEALSTLNRAYSEGDVWLTYGSALAYPSYRPLSHLPPSRDKRTVPQPPYSFYAFLFKQIELTDLFYRGRFYTMGWDGAILFPMLEMAGKKALPLTQILALQDSRNPYLEQNLHPKYREECLRYIASKKNYRPIKQIPPAIPKANEGADLFIFASDDPTQLKEMLEAVRNHVTGLNRTIAFYRAATSAKEAKIIPLKLTFPHVQFVKIEEDFKKHLLKQISQKTPPCSEMVILASDASLPSAPIDAEQGVRALLETNACALYYSHHVGEVFSRSRERFQPVPPCEQISNALMAWQLDRASDDWSDLANLNFTLYRKSDLKKLLSKLDFDSPETLLFEWGQREVSSEVGLFPQDGPLVDIH